jgi:polyisoprenyl-phosphate glycosyltransferase
MSVSIIIPAYNEQDAISSVIERIKKLPIDAEILVVDDGSTDKTMESAQQAGAIVFRRPGNIGYGKSIKDGLRHCKHDTVVITDADGTYPIESIPTLLEKYTEGYDMVVGARKGAHYWSSPLKSAFRILLQILVEFVTGKKIPDINSGLRVFSKKTAQQYEHELCDTFSFTTTITLVYFLTKHTILYLPISYEKRIGKSKVRHIKDGLRTLQYVIECIARFNPIKLFVLLSIFVTIIGAFSTIVVGWIGIFIGICTAFIVFSIGAMSESLRDKKHE